ncbi:uncharacterized protein LOC113304326 [Papaver somniferum]|uniref:uncharacterized protein LOC113304326 n=1 Tax=Papaver somniferum TaxID=3469 RepID=UPI000E6F5868|nr:uncharacterized protein LOC113304326 [Papaver somniferum]
MGKAWNLKGGFRMSLHEESMYIFEFDLDEDRVAAIEMGSVTILKKLFLIRPWQLFIEHSIQELKSVPVWMNLRKVPIHLWNAKGLSMIASGIGTPICSDKHTLERTRMSYARVCVEMDVTSDFPSFIPILFDGKELEISVEYTWKPPRCQACATFSHSSAKCPKVSASKVTKKIWVPKLSKTNKETLGRLEESQRLDLEVVNADMNIKNVSETDIDKAGNLETPRNEEHNDSGSLTEKGESRVQSNEEMVDNAAHISIEEKADSPDVERKYVRRKNKGSTKENEKKVDELKNKNSFESLIEVNEDLPSVETFVSQSNNNDQHNEDTTYVDDCVESNEESEYETDNEETSVEKFKPIEEHLVCLQLTRRLGLSQPLTRTESAVRMFGFQF